MNESYIRHTITLNDMAFLRLKNKGHFGETYSDVILRLLNQIDSSGHKGRREND